MSSTMLDRDDLLPRKPESMGKGAMLAIGAHALLIAILAYGVNWHASEPEGVEAELWSATPQMAAPKAAETPPPPPAPPPAPVKPREAPPPPPPAVKPQVDPQIAIEQAKKEREEKKREELKARQEQEKRQKQLEAQAAEDAKKLAAKKEQAEKLAQQQKQEADAKKAEAKKQQELQAKVRQDAMKRMMGLADATGDANATGNAMRSSGPSASYAGRIKALVRRNTTFADTVDGNPSVEVTLTVARDGTITSRKVTKPSNSREFDDAVLRGIDKTEKLPLDENGRVFSPMTIVYNLRDLKP